MGNQREESEEMYLESDDEGYGQRVVTSRRRNTIDSGSERSGENYYAASKDEEVNQARRSRYIVQSLVLFMTLHTCSCVYNVIVV